MRKKNEVIRHPPLQYSSENLLFYYCYQIMKTINKANSKSLSDYIHLCILNFGLVCA